MLTKMIAKLMLKACIPLVLVTGAVSYGHYVRGGDPAALFGGIASGALNSMKAAVTNTARDATKTVSSLKPGESNTEGGTGGGISVCHQIMCLLTR